MRLVIDGRTVDLDDTVERVVIEKSGFGAITVTSHLGIKKQVLPGKPQTVDHTAYRDAIRPNNNGHKPERKLVGFATPGFVATEKQKAAWKGKTCEACKKSGQGTRAKECSQCGTVFPATTRIRN